MRAISVKVNEVIGVAGFTVPGTRVDLLVMIRDNSDSMSRIGRQPTCRCSRRARGTTGRSPEKTASRFGPHGGDAAGHADRCGTNRAGAQTEGQIMLALRNPLDAESTRRRACGWPSCCPALRRRPEDRHGSPRSARRCPRRRRRPRSQRSRFTRWKRFARRSAARRRSGQWVSDIHPLRSVSRVGLAALCVVVVRPASAAQQPAEKPGTSSGFS